MAFYYVSSVAGAATGDGGRYASKQTGTFAALGAAGHYATIELAIAATTSPVLGDFIFVSDLHAHSQSGAINYNTVAAIVCVDDVNVDASRVSGRGKETVTGSNNIIIGTSTTISGLELTANNDIIASVPVTAQDCKLTVTGNGDLIFANSDGAGWNLINCEVALNNAGASLKIQNGATFCMLGGSVTTTDTSITNLFSTGFISGGGKIRFEGVDISSVSGTLIANVGASAGADDVIDVWLDMCKLASGVAFTNEVFKSYNQRALFTRCSNDSSLAEHQYHLTAFGGEVDDDSTIRRAEDDAFEDSGTIVSYKIVTNSDASAAQPLWFDFPNPRWMELATASTDTVRLHTASTSALTDADIYPEGSYFDGTNKQTPTFISGAPTTIGGTYDFLAAGTTLTTDSGSDWRDGVSALTGHTESLIDVDTSGDIGADCSPIVQVRVTKPSVTIQLGSIYEQVA